MKRLALIFLLFASTVTLAQAPTRVRGMITALEGDVLSVKSPEGKELKIQLAPDVGVSTARKATLDELKGKYVGVTATSKDGRLVALEVHALPPQAKPGHMPWDLQPGSTMTNANLDGIAEASGGNEMTLNYGGGSQKILVPPGTPIVAFVPGWRADLKPGEWIFTSAGKQGDKLLAQRITVSKDGVRPPQ
jgi:hypothetical protein